MIRRMSEPNDLVERPVAFLSGGCELRGVLTAPGGAGSLQGHVLCHGFLCTAAMGLPGIAQLLAAEGFAVLRFDYSGFGDSAGEPRGELWPERQSGDALAAVTSLRAQPECDPRRIALWGTSFGGAVVLHAAAHDPGVNAVIASVPVTNGESWIRGVNSAEQWAALQQRLAGDRERRAAGAPAEVVAVGEVRPAPPLLDPDRDAFFARYAAAAPPRELSLACVEAVLAFAPDALAGRIAPRPLLLIAAPDDAIVPLAQAESAFCHAGEPKRLVLLPPGVSHFAVYDGAPRARIVAETASFLRDLGRLRGG